MGTPTGNLFTTTEMDAIFSAESHVQKMLAFEAALARAEAEAGVIPQEAADAIEAGCRVELFDVPRIFEEVSLAGTPAIPLVRMLGEHIADPAKSYIHWGATSQDAIDTALALEMRDGLNLLVDSLRDLCKSAATLAEQHRHTLMAGRTLLQQAMPITFGLKAARWLALATRQIEALRRSRAQSLALQLGGAAGTLAVLGDKGLEVVRIVAQGLNLPLPDLPWHTERDRFTTVAATLGITAGSMAKIASDLVLLAQTEVGEVSEEAAPGKGGSSAMPQKRNPVDATMALAASRLALGQVPIMLASMAQEHERAAGAWQAEWQAIPDLFCFTSSAVARVGNALRDLQVDPQRMHANLQQSGGLLMSEALLVALAPYIGKQQAQHLVQAVGARALEQGISLQDASLSDEQIRAILPPDAIEAALDPASYLGSTDAFIDRALEGYQAMMSAENA